ncbi:hypothetical protein [Streptomyces sp. NPDC001530]|uniref:hypothetical protein n=1 Tax=Streptomyces sp. NPDC001530 TaxID=3364582 RepID=UPI003680C146
MSTDPWTVRGLEIRGTAVALFDVDLPVSFMSREVIRITPTWVCAWGLDPDVQGRRARSQAAKASGNDGSVTPSLGGARSM